MIVGINFLLKLLELKEFSAIMKTGRIKSQKPLPLAAKKLDIGEMLSCVHKIIMWMDFNPDLELIMVNIWD